MVKEQICISKTNLFVQNIIKREWRVDEESLFHFSEFIIHHIFRESTYSFHLYLFIFWKASEIQLLDFYEIYTMSNHVSLITDSKIQPLPWDDLKKTERPTVLLF